MYCGHHVRPLDQQLEVPTKGLLFPFRRKQPSLPVQKRLATKQASDELRVPAINCPQDSPLLTDLSLVRTGIPR
jgi:hypothetical protein